MVKFSLLNFGSLTKCIKSNPTKFLGQIVSMSNNTTCQLSASALSSTINDSLQRINNSPIRGDYKIWIYRNYLVPSIFFQLSVNKYTKSFISKLQAKITKFLKSWLHLPRSSTLSILYHPDVLKLPYIPHTLEKAKLKCLSTITSSLDPAVSELQNCADIVRNSLSVPNTCLEVFTSIVESVSKDTPHYSQHINRTPAKLMEFTSEYASSTIKIL